MSLDRVETRGAGLQGRSVLRCFQLLPVVHDLHRAGGR